MLLLDAAMVIVAAVFYGLLTLVALGLTAGLAQSLAKLSLDATIQGGVPRHVQASAFARSDTTVQLAWVIGGFVGIAMPLIPRLGLSVAGDRAGGLDGVRARHPAPRRAGADRRSRPTGRP